MDNKKDVLIFYNKTIGKQLGYYSVYGNIVSDINFAHLFHDNYLKINKVLDDIYNGKENYFNNLKEQLFKLKIKREDIETKYIDCDTLIRFKKIKNVRK